ncbi:MULTISPECIES: hypothetical protein [Neisseria]|uniref:DUF2059 domain-containing protein n=2 Tax=Betaproteobacteria TaxID=28216 RepID=A0ABP2KFT3_NEIMU|nr:MULTISPECIES: hypothetical protein [Neisseria]EFV81733.1 hypothetical protein HMPREF0604_00312 [Neisseria mucosa C102]OFM20142.1 hypothetical protein HMPREF2711_10400 [Neisseria sp. HMSC070A01]QKI21674.1 hypothetical protein FOC66_01875 [Neisseria mucosa]
MKLKYLLVACAALFVSTQSLAAKPSDESAMKWLEIQDISNNYSEKVQRSLEMVNKEDNERLLAMTPKTQKAQMKAVISRYMKNMQDDLSRPELKKQWLDEEKRAVQKVFTQEEVDATNRFFSSAQGKNILKKIRSLQQHGGNLEDVLSQSDIEKMAEAFGHGAGKSALEKVKHFDKLSDEIIQKNMSQNYLNASDKYTPAFEAQTRDILCKGNKHSSECAK